MHTPLSAAEMTALRELNDRMITYNAPAEAARRSSNPKRLETDALCPVCGVGFILPSGTCDHCNQKPHA